jgi:transcription elongation factor Elf1
MGILTSKQKASYLVAPSCCPFCKSEDISAGRIQAESMGATSECECESCGENWIDEYALTGVSDL